MLIWNEAYGIAECKVGSLASLVVGYEFKVGYKVSIITGVRQYTLKKRFESQQEGKDAAVFLVKRIITEAMADLLSEEVQEVATTVEVPGDPK